MSLLSVKKLELQNFMTHRQESVEMPDQGSVLLWGPSGAGKCLPAGTTLWSSENSPISIEQVVLGKLDRVLGVVEGEVCEVKVTDWHRMGKKPLLSLHLEDGSSLLCAETHRIRTMAGCLEAREIVPGMMVATASPAPGSKISWVEAERVESHPEAECFDITVDTAEHLYLAENMVVHNSSLLDAVGFALYGVNATRAATLDELRHELYPDEDFGVRLTLSLGDKQVQVFRGVESGKTVTWMVGPDGDMTEGPRAVSDKVSEMMGGMDAATFFATYYSQQGELDALVKMAGGGRRKFVQRMMGITLLDKVSTQINRELLKASERIQALDDSLPQESKQEIAQAVKQAEEGSSRLEDAVKALQAELEALKVKGEGLAERLKASEAELQQFNRVLPQLKALEETTLPALEEQAEKLSEEIKQAEQAKDRLAVSSGELEKLAALQAEADLLSESEGALAALERLTGELAKAEAHLKSLPAPEELEAPDQLQAELHALHTQVAVAKSRGQLLQDHLSELQGAGSCPLCRQEIADPANLLEQLESELEELSQSELSDKNKADQLSERLERAKKASESAMQRDQASQRVDEAEKALREAKNASEGADAARLQAIRAEIQQKAERKAGLEADLKSSERLPALLKQAGQVKDRLTREKAKLAELRAQLEQLSHDPKKHQELSLETDQSRQEYMALRDRLASAREERAEAQAELNSLRLILENYDKTVEDRKQAEVRHGLLTRLDRSMKDFKSNLVGQIRPSLQATTSAHLSALTEGKMSGVEIDDDYNIEVVTSDGKRRLGLCSGGEQARVAFALRLALTQLVSSRTDTPVGFMVFDEIFGSQDEGHRRAILESLRYVRGMLPQVMFISHEQSLRESDLIDTIVDVPDTGSASRIQVSAR